MYLGHVKNKKVKKLLENDIRSNGRQINEL